MFVVRSAHTALASARIAKFVMMTGASVPQSSGKTVYGHSKMKLGTIPINSATETANETAVILVSSDYLVLAFGGATNC